MDNNLERVGLIFKADGAVDFTKSLKEVNASIQENRSEFNLIKSTWDESTKSAEKLRTEQEYLSKQTKDYSDKVKLLEGELEDLQKREATHAEKLSKKIEQYEAVKKAEENYKEKCSILRQELEQLENSEDKNTSAIEKKIKELQRAENGFADYSIKAESIGKELEKLNKGEANNEAAIRKKRRQLNEAKTTLNNYENSLNNVEKELKSGTISLKEYAQEVDDLGEKAKNAGDKMGAVSAGAAGIMAGVTALVPATEEYRKIMASLESSSELAGYTTEETKEIYQSFFGVLSDEQSAATTTANLQALNLSQRELKQLVNGTIGAWAKYGDSIPIDGLAEAINETVKVGQVTGNFADVLNWAGTSEEAFNLKLEKCKSDTERVNLVMQELANQGLTQAGKKWQENNDVLVESNRAQAELQEETAKLAEEVAPVLTDITELIADMLGWFNDLPSGTQKAIGGIVLFVAALAPLLSGIGMVTTGIGGMMTASSGMVSLLVNGAPVVTKILSGIGAGAKGLFAIIAANPVVAVIMSIIAAVVLLYNKCEWFRDGVNRIFGSIKEFIKNTIDKIKGFFDFEWKLPKISLPRFKIDGRFSLSPPSVPKFSVEWFAKGGILNRPTIFGMNDGSFMGGGEAGKEAVLPIELLRKYIREENQSSMNELIVALMSIFNDLVISPEINLYVGNEKLVEVFTEAVRVKIGERQNARWRGKGNV